MIRKILEASLVLEPSSESLDSFLPKIGDAIALMMKMLKEKQTEVSRIESSKRSGSLSTISSVNSLKPEEKSSSNYSKNQDINTSVDINRTPSKDPITRLQNNTDLKRRASKRYSAYQTSSIISMQSPQSVGKFNASDIPQTPMYNDLSPDVTAEDIEKAKRTSNLFDIEEIESESTKKNNSSSSDQNHDIAIQATTNALTGGRRTTSMSIKAQDVQPVTYNGIFLKYKEQVKKVHVNLPTSFANLKILYTQTFNYSPPGISPFPKFYIQDDANSIAYELENIDDIRYGSIISLQQPDLQTAIIGYMESQINGIKNDLMNMEDRIFKRFEELQLYQVSQTPATQSSTISNIDDMSYEREMKRKIEQNQKQQQLLDDLSTQFQKLKQHQLRTSSKLTEAVSETIKNIDKLQDSGLVPANITESAYVKDCKVKVSEGCESLVEKLDDLQDVIEFMKRDITKHSIKPSQKQLDHIAKEMKKTKDDLKKFTDFTSIERKNLASIWTKQMAAIAADQRFFKAQEEIISLLEQDYQSAEETFNLIISCAKQLEKGSANFKAKLPVQDPSISPWDASQLVMAEVDGIVPNHEERIEAIMKAERVREMEKELRLKDEFKEELDDFVSNEKLKKTSISISELEKMRQEKDMENFKATMGII